MKQNKRLKTWVVSVLTFVLGLGCGVVTDRFFHKPVQTTVNCETPASAEPDQSSVSDTNIETDTNTEKESTPTYTIGLNADGNYCVNGDDNLIIANKSYKLAEGFEPSNLEYGYECSTGACMMQTPAANAVREMISAAANDGITLRYSSSFRDESYQRSLYNSYAARDGAALADTYSSRPGYSDHQTGLSADFISYTNANADFDTEAYAATAEGQWLAENAYKFGFIQRYPEGKQAITGYQWESWHYRYVGVDYAQQMHDADPGIVNTSMEEFFGFAGGETYND